MTNPAEPGRQGPSDDVPASPCIGVCRIDRETELCQGCSRTLIEIAAWSTASPSRKRAILGAALSRRRR